MVSQLPRKTTFKGMQENLPTSTIYFINHISNYIFNNDYTKQWTLMISWITDHHLSEKCTELTEGNVVVHFDWNKTETKFWKEIALCYKKDWLQDPSWCELYPPLEPIFWTLFLGDPSSRILLPRSCWTFIAWCAMLDPQSRSSDWQIRWDSRSCNLYASLNSGWSDEPFYTQMVIHRTWMKVTRTIYFSIYIANGLLLSSEMRTRFFLETWQLHQDISKECCDALPCQIACEEHS